MEFICQNPHCRKPILIDESISDLDVELFSNLSLNELETKLKECEQQHVLQIGEGREAGEESFKPPSFSGRENNLSSSLFRSLRGKEYQPKESNGLTNLPGVPLNPTTTTSIEGFVVVASPTSPTTSLSSSAASSAPTLSPRERNSLGRESPTPTHNSNSAVNQPLSLNSKSLALGKLFELLSDESGIDHPLCRECTQKLLQSLERRVAESLKEQQVYQSYYTKLEEEHVRSLSKDELELQIQALEEEERSLKEDLRKVAQDRLILEEEQKYIAKETKDLQDLEERYFQQFLLFQQEYQNFIDDNESINTKLINATEELERLKITNVYNDTFHIWYDGHFGTINQFRLGRLPSQPVDWNEINAAWGQATLLLHTIAKKLSFKFTTFRLLPMGSASKMERISDKNQYELFGSSDISLGRLFWYRRFDNAMAAFLTCLAELGDHAESIDKNFKLPYRIEKDRIGDMSIKIQFNNEETWTKALKYMLTNLKFLLVFAAKQLKST